MTPIASRQPTMSVVSSSQPEPGRGWQAWRDGTIASTAGGLITGSAGLEAFKTFVTHEHEARWWMVAATAVGLGLFIVAALLRRTRRRRHRVAIVVTAPDAVRGLPGAQQLEQQAERYGQQRFSVTLKATIPTGPGERPTRALVEGLADRTIEAVTLAERLTPDATRIHVIPAMPLTAGFWFGARLGSMHPRDLRIHQSVNGNGDYAYFDATSLRPSRTRRRPLTADPVRTLGGDPTTVVLAIDLLGRGDGFDAEVTRFCDRSGIGALLSIHSPPSRLMSDTKTFDAVVTQITQAWEDAALTPAARTGMHTIVLSGPLSIAVALGARLAAAEYGRWRAFSFNRANASFEELAP